MRDTVDAMPIPSQEAYSAKPIGEPMQTVRRISMPQSSVSSATAALSAKIGKGCSLRLPRPQGNAIFCLSMGDDDSPDWSNPVLLSGAFGAIEIAAGARFLLGLCGIDIDAAADAGARQWLHSAALGRLGGTPFAAAEHLSSGNVKTPSGTVVLRMLIRSEGHIVTTHARADVSCWLDFLARSSWMKARSPARALSHVPLVFKLPIAHHSMPMRKLRTLAAGDIIVPATPYFSSSGDGTVRLGRVFAQLAYRAPNTFEIIAMENDLDTEDYESMNDIDAESESAASAGAFEPNDPATAGGENAPANLMADAVADQVPVNLEFMLGHVRMPFGELRRLKEGAILQVEDGSPASISILCSGQVLGQGEVVDVNGKLGIRVVLWGSS